MTDHRAPGRAPFTPVELRGLWTYSDGTRTVKAYWRPGGPGAGPRGSWGLADPDTGDITGEVAAGEFSRRFHPVDEFADVRGFPTYLGAVTAADGTALVDLVLDRNPFMLANGPGRTARPHVLMVPRRHRDGWSSAPAPELAARHTAMTLVAAWYRDLDGGHAVFAANDSAANVDYLRDAEAANGTFAGTGFDVTVTRNPRQEVQHAHLHAFYAEDAATGNHESAAPALGYPVFSGSLGGDAVEVDGASHRFAAHVRTTAQFWGGSYCSYQPGPDGPLAVMPALGTAQDEFNRRLARADGLRAEPDPRLGGAVNLVRPGLDDAGRRQAAQLALAEHKASFAAFLAGRGLDARSLPAGLALLPASAVPAPHHRLPRLERQLRRGRPR